jgi:hypothetical protein
VKELVWAGVSCRDGDGMADSSKGVSTLPKESREGTMAI